MAAIVKPTEERRTAAYARLAPYMGDQSRAAAATIEAIGGFKVVVKVAQYAMKAVGQTLGDTGPIPKSAVALVAANALRSYPTTEAAVIAGIVKGALIEAGQPDAMAGSVAQAVAVAVLADGPYAPGAQTAQPVAPAPAPAPTAQPVAAPVQTPVASAVAQTVADPVPDPVAEAVAREVVAAPVAQTKAKRGKVDRSRGTETWNEWLAKSPAMQARPEGNWQWAADVFDCKVVGYVEVYDGSHIMVPHVDPDFVWNADLLQRLVAAVNETIPTHTWLWGERGTGKTTVVEQFCARLGRPLFPVTFQKLTEAADVIGGTGLSSGSTEWEDGMVLRALRDSAKGAIVMLDEICYAQAGNITGPLNEIIHPSLRYNVPQTGEKIAFDPRILFIACDNTNGTGDTTGRYTDTRPANRALVDRFGAMWQVTGLTKREEIAAIKRRAFCSEDIADKTQGLLRVLRSKVGIELADPPSLREAIAFAKFLRGGFVSPADAFDGSFAQKYPLEAQEEMRNTFLAYWNDGAPQQTEVSGGEQDTPL